MNKLKINNHFDVDSDVVLYNGDCLELLKEIPDETVKLVVTSPPYNIVKLI